MSIVVTTPTGNVGRQTVKRLVEAGADVAVIARNKNKLDDSVRDKVKVFEGSLTDINLVTEAFRGAKAVFWVTPSEFSNPDLFSQDSVLADVAAKAVRENKVPFVVNLSSAGANLDKAGAISALRIVELRLNDATENIFHLRPGFYYENFLHHIEPMKNAGSVFTSVPGDAKFPMIATSDIADVAATLLLGDTVKGISIRGLHGPDDLSMNQAMKIISESLNKSFNYVAISPEDGYKGLVGAGAPPKVAKAYIDMEYAIGNLLGNIEPRTPQTTTPTKMKDWCDENLRPLF